MRGIKKAFDVIELLERLKVKYKSYMLTADVEVSYHTLLGYVVEMRNLLGKNLKNNSSKPTFLLWSNNEL